MGRFGVWNKAFHARSSNEEVEIEGFSNHLSRNLKQHTKKNTMQTAINELTVALNTLETNEPINRTEGNIPQADLEVKNAAEIRQALAVLTNS